MKTQKITKALKDNAIRIVISGVVQGVGFRPFIYRLAHKFQYTGWVKNIGFGVEIHLESKKKTDFEEFLKALHETQPPLSQIEETILESDSFLNLKDFTIQKTKGGESFVFISPDISISRAAMKK